MDLRWEILSGYMPLFVEGLWNPSDSWHVRAGLFADGLAADRTALGGDSPDGGAVQLDFAF